MDRRQFLSVAAHGGLAAAGALVLPHAARGVGTSLGPDTLPRGTLEAGHLDVLPGKRPLIRKTYRPPNYETPVELFNETFTPNDAFFVRYHLSNIPSVDAATWRLRIGGDAIERPFELTFEQLRRDFPAVELAAVCQCSGNRRGLFIPHVPGVEWGYGAMGQAMWKGVRLKDILAKAGIRKEALEVSFEGTDSGVLEQTPRFVKSMPAWKALDDNTLVAYAMNGEPLPHFNGFPARLVVPGWTATYWMKHIVSLNVLSQPFKGFWVNTAYRIPKGRFPVVDRFVSQENDASTPITEMVVNSLITNLPERGFRCASGQLVTVKGIAWDGGYGVRDVEVSVDAGKSWSAAQLGEDWGRFAWRAWQHSFTPPPGRTVVMARATNRLGQTQTTELIHNPAGYHHNVVQRVEIEVG